MLFYYGAQGARDKTLPLSQPSSPVRKAQRVAGMNRQRRRVIQAITLSIIFFIVHLLRNGDLVGFFGFKDASPAIVHIKTTAPAHNKDTSSPSNTKWDTSSRTDRENLDTEEQELVSITAVLPTNRQLLPSLYAVLLPIINLPIPLEHLVITCSESDYLQTRISLQAFLSDIPRSNAEISIVPWDAVLPMDAGIQTVAVDHSSSSHTMILQKHGLTGATHQELEALSRAIDGSSVHDAAALFLSHNSLPLLFFSTTALRSLDKASFSRAYNSLRQGGVKRSFDSRSYEFMTRNDSTHPPPDLDYLEVISRQTARVAVVFPTQQELLAFSLAVCQLQELGEVVDALVLSPDADADSEETWAAQILFTDKENCNISYRLLPKHFANKEISLALKAWATFISRVPEILFTSDADIKFLLSSVFSCMPNVALPTLIYIPPIDLPYTDWIGSLCIDELKRERSYYCIA